MLPENYREISLLDTGYKILTTLIMGRLNPYVTGIIRDYQCGFIKGKSNIYTQFNKWQKNIMNIIKIYTWYL